MWFASTSWLDSIVLHCSVSPKCPLFFVNLNAKSDTLCGCLHALMGQMSLVVAGSFDIEDVRVEVRHTGICVDHVFVYSGVLVFAVH